MNHACMATKLNERPSGEYWTTLCLLQLYIRCTGSGRVVKIDNV